MNNETKTYLSHLKTIHYMTNSFANQNQLDKDDLLSLANSIFIKCYQNFDSKKKTKFNTYFTFCLKKQFIQYREYQNKYIATDSLELFIDKTNTQDNENDFFEWKESLSLEAQKIIDIIFTEKTEYIHSPKTKKITKESLFKYLKKNNWKNDKIIFYYFQEITNALAGNF